MLALGTLTLRSFMLFKEAELNLNNQGLVLIRGENRDTTSCNSNGAGKTTIFDAAFWALFGDLIQGDPTEDVINWDSDDCEVRVELHAPSGEIYDVIRQRSRKRGGKLQLLQGDQPVAGTGATQTDIQNCLNEVLGLDFITARSTVLCGQNDISHFAAPGMKDAQQKSILKRLLRLERIDAAKKWIGKVWNELETRRRDAQNAIRYAEGQLSAIPGANALIARREALIEQRKRRGSINTSLTAAQEEEKEAADVVKNHQQLKAHVQKLQQSQVRLASLITRYESTARSCAAEASKFAARIAKFSKGGACPECGTPSTGEHVARHLAELEADLLLARENQDQAQVEADSTRAKLRKIEGALKNISETLRDEALWQAKWRKASASIATLKAELLAIDRTAAELERLDKQLADIDNAKVKCQAVIDAKKLIVEELDNEARHLEFWSRGFGNQGLASFILDDIMPEMTARTNHYLSILSDGYLTTVFDTQRELKSGETRDKLSVITNINGRRGRTSGGEAKKLALATRLGLRAMACARQESGINLLAMDEILDGLDDASKQRIEQLLARLRESIGSIYVITHENNLTEIFERAITVVKERNVARLEF